MAINNGVMRMEVGDNSDLNYYPIDSRISTEKIKNEGERRGRKRIRKLDRRG